MFIFKSKGQKEIHKLYKELEKEYKQLDKFKDELHQNRNNPHLSDCSRADIAATETRIAEIKKKIIILEK